MTDVVVPSVANIAAAAAIPMTEKQIQALKLRDEAKAKLIAAGVEKVSGNNVMGLVTVLKKGPANVDAAVQQYIAALPARREAIKTAKKKGAAEKAAAAPPKVATPKKKNVLPYANVRNAARYELTAALQAVGATKDARMADAVKLVGLREKDPAAANAFFADVVSRKGKVRSSEKARAAAKRAATAAKKKNAPAPKHNSTRKSPKKGLAARIAALLEAAEIPTSEVCRLCAAGGL